jgi:hypothetical protein
MYHSVNLWDAYFGSDLPRSYANMIDLSSDFSSMFKHPLYTLALFPASQLIQKSLNISPDAATWTLLAANAFLWTFALFTCVYAICHKLLDTIIYTLLGMSCASTLFWLTVPETFGFGATTILIPFLLLTNTTVASQYVLSVFVNLCAASITITNWMIGLIGSFLLHGPRRTLSIALHTLAVLTVLWSVQKIFIPTGTFFMDFRLIKHETYRLRAWQDQSFLAQTRSLLVTPLTPYRIASLVIPAQSYDFGGGVKWPDADLPMVTIPHGARTPAMSLLGPHVPVPVYVGVCALWLLLLGIGATQLARSFKTSPLCQMIGLGLVGQFALHWMYGTQEAFIYSAHWTPFLILLAALASTSRWRSLCLTTSLALTTYCFIFNSWHLLACWRELSSFSIYTL